MESLLQTFGKTVSSRILRDSNGVSRGVGFARMDAHDQCEVIIQQLNGYCIPGNTEPIQCRYADSTSQKRTRTNSVGSNTSSNLAMALPASQQQMQLQLQLQLQQQLQQQQQQQTVENIHTDAAKNSILDSRVSDLLERFEKKTHLKQNPTPFSIENKVGLLQEAADSHLNFIMKHKTYTPFSVLSQSDLMYSIAEDPLLKKFTNCLMYDGKKHIAQSILLDTILQLKSENIGKQIPLTMSLLWPGASESESGGQTESQSSIESSSENDNKNSVDNNNNNNNSRNSNSNSKSESNNDEGKSVGEMTVAEWYQRADDIALLANSPLSKPFDPISLLHLAIENVKPIVECKSTRVSGSVYQVPFPLGPRRQISLAIKWLIKAARDRKKPYTMSERLAVEIKSAVQEEGPAVKKRAETHKVAEANRAFAHFRWVKR